MVLVKVTCDPEIGGKGERTWTEFVGQLDISWTYKEKSGNNNLSSDVTRQSFGMPFYRMNLSKIDHNEIQLKAL